MPTPIQPTYARSSGAAARVLLAAAVASASILVITNDTAHAITGRSLVTVTSAASSVNKFVTAACPAGKDLIGTGSEIVDGDGNVLITDVVPDATLTSVSVTGGENGPYAGNWQVRALAMCAPAGSIPNLQRVSASAANNGTSDFTKDATATCPDGLRLFGTGYQTTDANGNVAMRKLEPDTGLTSVSTSATETNPYAPTWDWAAYAICGEERSTMTRVSAVSTLDSNPVHGIMTNPCDTTVPGTTLTGVGAYSEAAPFGAWGYLHIDRMSLDLRNNRVAVNAWEDPDTGSPATGTSRPSRSASPEGDLADLSPPCGSPCRASTRTATPQHPPRLTCRRFVGDA